jgi:high affinity choline transporter 7
MNSEKTVADDQLRISKRRLSFRRNLAAVGLLFVILMGIGCGIYWWRGEVYWPGFLAMSFFYCLMFYIGLAASREKENQTQELLLAGRSLPLGMALLTMTATWVGGGFINGTAESVSSSGLAWAQAPWGYALSLVIGGLIFARPMRRRNYTTMLDPLSDRFGTTMAGLLYLPALLGEIFWTAAILTALGTTFGYILELPFDLSIIVSAAIAIVYTSFGGMRSVAVTDVFQLAILIFGLALAVPFVMPTGGWSGLWASYQETFPDAAYPWPSMAWGNSFYLWWDYALLLVFGGIPWHVYFQRVLSSKSEATAQWLSVGAGGLCLLAALPAVLIGMVCATTDWSQMGLAGPENSAIALPYVLKHLTPALVATIGLGALAAAVMSSVDSSILSASSMGAWNLYRPLTGADESVDLQVVIRRLIWIVGIAATLLALQIKSVYALWFLCSDLVYCILFAQLVTALFDPKANAWGSFAGFVVAAALRLGGGEPALGLPRWIAYPMVDVDGVVQFPFRTTSMLAGLLTIIIVSRLTQQFQLPRPLVTRNHDAA